MTRAIAERPPTPARGPLSGQDLALLALIATGQPFDAVARRLLVSERTVRRRTRQVCDRIEVASPIEAVVWAVRRGLI